MRNVLIRGSYEPAAAPTAGGAAITAELAAEVKDTKLDAETLLRRYATLVYFRTGSYLGAARRLGLDRRTVKARVDPEYLERLRGGPEVR